MARTDGQTDGRTDGGDHHNIPTFFSKSVGIINGFISFTMPIKDKHFDSHSLLKFLRNKTFIDYRKVNCQFKLTIMASKRKFLTLEERVKVISLFGKGHSCRRVASDLGVEKLKFRAFESVNMRLWTNSRRT